jgi:hypothetical protein
MFLGRLEAGFLGCALGVNDNTEFRRFPLVFIAGSGRFGMGMD